MQEMFKTKEREGILRNGDFGHFLVERITVLMTGTCFKQMFGMMDRLDSVKANVGGISFFFCRMENFRRRLSQRWKPIQRSKVERILGPIG